MSFGFFEYFLYLVVHDEHDGAAEAPIYIGHVALEEPLHAVFVYDFPIAVQLSVVVPDIFAALHHEQSPDSIGRVRNGLTRDNH